MGQPKALLPLGGETCVARVARLLRACGADPVVVVTGIHDAIIREALSGTGAGTSPLIVFNPAHESGQISSLIAGLDVVESTPAEAVVVAPVDHPAVRADTVARLILCWGRARPPVVRPVFSGRHGHPVIFDRAVWPLLRDAPLDRGARAVVRALGDAVVDVEVDDRGVVLDLDRPEDYAALIDAIDRGVVGL